MYLGKAASLRPSAYLNNSLQTPYTSVSSTCGYSSPICSLLETVKYTVLLSGLQELWGKTIYDKFSGKDIRLALTNVLARDTVYTQKKELLTGGKCVLQTTSKGS